MPIATRDFVELMTDQKVPNQTERGLWKIGQILYVKLGRHQRVSFINTPIALTKIEKRRFQSSHDPLKQSSNNRRSLQDSAKRQLNAAVQAKS